jgi:hypothetical protein
LEGLKRDAEMEQWHNKWQREDRIWEEGRRASLLHAFDQATTDSQYSEFYRHYTAPEQIGIRSQMLGIQPRSTGLRRITDSEDNQSGRSGSW